MALRANDADDYKSWLALGNEGLGKVVVAEVETELMVTLLVETKRVSLIAWQRFLCCGNDACFGCGMRSVLAHVNQHVRVSLL